MIRLIVICSLGLTLFMPVANAEEKPMNLISCRSGTVTMLSASKELTVYGYEFKGIDRGNKGDMTFDNFTHRGVGVSMIKEGSEPLSKGYAKYMDADGDFFVVSWDGLMGSVQRSEDLLVPLMSILYIVNLNGCSGFTRRINIVRPWTLLFIDGA